MTNIVITSTTNTIAINFNDLSGDVNCNLGVWRKESIIFIKKRSDRVEVKCKANYYFFAYNSLSDTLRIDSIAGVSVSSNNDLFTKLIALIQ